MVLDVLGLLSACSYALDCVEAELVHVSDKHAKRVAYMSVCMAEQLGISDESLQDLAACALLHDNALTQYIQEELHKDVANVPQASQGSAPTWITASITSQPCSFNPATFSLTSSLICAEITFPSINCAMRHFPPY